MDAGDEVLEFWFGPPGGEPLARQDRWWAKDAAFDATCRERFEHYLERAARGELEHWRATPRGALAYVVLLDQLSRNVWRGTPRSFANDARALAAARDAVARGFDRALTPIERSFLYMPFEHAEDLPTQEESVAKFTELAATAPPDLAAALEVARDYAVRHRDVIARFGRFPHRNAILGRTSTPDETEHLADPGVWF